VTTAAGGWRCPRCRGGLAAGSDGLQCAGCGARYPVIAGLADLRLPGPSAIDAEVDAEQAARLAQEADVLPLDELIRRALSSRSPEQWSAPRLLLRTRQSLQAPERLRGELHEWLRPCAEGGGPVLDAGCGFGGLIAAAGAEGIEMIGVDASLLNLVVARRLIEERGRPARLAAALVEHLPLADGSVAGVVSLDVVEHVASPAVFVREIVRVTRPGGFMALSTPNRFSLAAEPHVGAWGVGWLPRLWQAPYVRWRTGITYSRVRLLSAREIRRLLRQAGSSCDVEAPPVPADELAAFGPRRRRLAALYNRLARRRWMRMPLRMVGPFFHVIARKPAERPRPARV
jgi:SAM-dependent methyltransferase